MHGIDFIQDLAVITAAAGFFGWACQRIGLSMVVGFIAAGILVGPSTPPFALVSDSGHIATAAAALAHLDLALATVAGHSPAQAERAARMLLAGSGGEQRDYIVPQVIARGNSLVAAFERWVRGHIAEQFLITDAARELGVTVRSLQRATQAEIGMSPRDFVNEIRLERATRLLRTTNATVETVAARVGYLNAGPLRGLFRRRRGRSIAEVRATPMAWQDRSAQ